MNAKAKAMKLVERYMPYVDDQSCTILTLHENAKKCALIAVDEMIIEAGVWTGGPNTEWDKERFIYLESVKREIEAL